MPLWQTRRHWEALARRDPFWAVLSHPEKTKGRWDIDEFFSTGADEVDAALAAVRQLHPSLSFGRALDFGCGVGRLTHGLARHFETTVGVDISSEMLGRARTLNRSGDRATFVHNTLPHLRCFGSGEFNFVFSLITLQHVPPAYSRGYIAEFFRICRPEGIVMFQIPATRGPGRRRFSLYPPTLVKRMLMAFNHVFPVLPVMEMHAIPRNEVIGLIEAAGGRLLSVQDNDAAGNELESHVYIAVKQSAGRP